MYGKRDFFHVVGLTFSAVCPYNPQISTAFKELEETMVLQVFLTSQGLVKIWDICSCKEATPYKNTIL